jgi:hypothetical protein
LLEGGILVASGVQGKRCVSGRVVREKTPSIRRRRRVVPVEGNLVVVRQLILLLLMLLLLVMMSK